jgi:Uma2 family endonuclease
LAAGAQTLAPLPQNSGGCFIAERNVMTVATYKWTLDRYHQAVAAGVFDEQAVELLKGELVVMPPEGEPHVVYLMSATDYLRHQLGERATIRESHPITLADASEPEPDIAVVVPPIGRYLAHHPYPEDIFWLVEFANTTLDKDLGIKKEIYAAAGIQEYWVVNLKALYLKVFRELTPNGYRTELTLTEGAIAPIAFPDVQIEVKKMFSV